MDNWLRCCVLQEATATVKAMVKKVQDNDGRLTTLQDHMTQSRLDMTMMAEAVGGALHQVRDVITALSVI